MPLAVSARYERTILLAMRVIMGDARSDSSEQLPASQRLDAMLTSEKNRRLRCRTREGQVSAILNPNWIAGSDNFRDKTESRAARVSRDVVYT